MGIATLDIEGILNILMIITVITNLLGFTGTVSRSPGDVVVTLYSSSFLPLFNESVDMAYCKPEIIRYYFSDC